MKCRVYDADCVSPTRCTVEDVCCAGDCAPAAAWETCTRAEAVERIAELEASFSWQTGRSSVPRLIALYRARLKVLDGLERVAPLKEGE